MKSDKPIIVSMGEPSGISSEIIIKAWLKRDLYKIPPFILIDDLKKLNQVRSFFNLKANFQVVTKENDINKIFSRSIPIIDLKANIDFTPGNPNPKNSKYVLKSINEAFEYVYMKKSSRMLTLPVCKTTLKKAKFNFNGQTEYLSYLTSKKNKKKYSEIMILSTSKPVDKGKNLIVGLVTTHIPLRKIYRFIDQKIIFEKIVAFKNSLSKIWQIRSPKIAITSLNPHAGEEGLIGNEEIETIKPIIEKCKNKKIKVIGPLSGDSCFHKSKREQYDGILCLYHDQGLIPIKTLDFNHSINVTGGLPFLRVSPDHGPAFDIAKKNIASLESLVASFDFLKKRS